MDLAALRAYANVAERAAAIGQAGNTNPLDETQSVDSANFAGLVTDAVSNVEEAVKTAEDMTTKVVTGEAQLVDVVTTMAAAEVQLESVIAVRDQVIKAYREIMQMPI